MVASLLIAENAVERGKFINPASNEIYEFEQVIDFENIINKMTNGDTHYTSDLSRNEIVLCTDLLHDLEYYLAAKNGNTEKLNAVSHLSDYFSELLSNSLMKF